MDWGLAKLVAGRFSSLTRINESAYDKHFLHDEVAGNSPSCCPGTQRGCIVTPGEVKCVNNRTVYKCGRTTGSTKGELNTIDSSVRMCYEFDGGGHEIVEGKVLLVVSPPENSTLWPGG